MSIQSNGRTRREAHEKSDEGHDESPIRASISFPPDLYRTLEELARQKKVSVAWVVRDAAEQYIANQTQVHKQK